MNPTVIDTVEKAQAAGQAYSQMGREAYQGAVKSGTLNNVLAQYKPTTTTINAGEIGKIQPYQLPKEPTPTAAPALSTTLSSVNNNISQTRQAETEEATQNTSAAQPTERESVVNRIFEIAGLQKKQSEKTLALQEEEGVFEKKKQARLLEDKYMSRYQALQDQIAQMEKQSGGTVAGTNQAVNRFRVEGERELANIAIQQKIAQGAYTEANEIITAKIEAEFEPLKNELETYKSLYTILQNDLTESEKLQAQSEINKKELDYKNLSETKLELSKALIENGRGDLIAGLDGKTPEEMIQFAGKNGIPIDTILDRQKKQLEISKLNKEIAAIGVPTITNPDAGQYSQALSVILGSGKFTKEQKADVIRAVNNGEDPFAVVKNQAKNIMGQTLATDLDKYETAKSQLESIETLLSQYYAGGGKTNLFKGSYEKSINKLGEVNDPNLVSIATNIAAALQIYRNAVSGTAYSVQEGKDIASIFPGINKSEGLNKAILSGRMQAFQSTIDAKYRNTLGSTYDTLKGAQTTKPSTIIKAPDGTEIEIID